jgi:hypothetical protein
MVLKQTVDYNEGFVRDMALAAFRLFKVSLF